MKLNDWFLSLDAKDFPLGVDYVSRYKAIIEWLQSHVYGDEAIGVLREELNNWKGNPRELSFVTKHGEPHIMCVMDRLSQMLNSSGGPYDLKPYEAYLLLVSVRIHDSGMVLGWNKHAENCSRIMASLGNLAGDDAVEKKMIMDIVKAHYCEDNGDTISKLPQEETISGEQIRPQYLAAALRFADELAEDRTRACRFSLDNGLLEGSEIYHAYAMSLDVPAINGREVRFQFYLSEQTSLRHYKKGNEESFLIEEIFERTLMTHIERAYCMMFMPAPLRIDSICVRIYVVDNRVDHFMQELERKDYRLKESYPARPENGIYTLCPELVGWPDECRQHIALKIN